MTDRPFAVVGDGNFSGNTFTNVGNQTFNYHIYPNERRIFTLESRVSFDALLNSEARYPAPKCHPATRKAAQKVVKNWLCRKGDGSEKGIMWMSGAPGVGKSAVAQSVCEELCGDDGSKSWLSRIVHRDRYLDGSFFFGRGFENREKASFFPATIAYQLCRSRVSCRTTINRAISKRQFIFSEDFPFQFRHLLTKPAQKTGFLQSPITVVVDGLDECNSIPDQVKLLELILEAVKTGNMRFFIASRPEQDIFAFFRRRDVSQHTWHVQLDEESFKTSEDIKVFLRAEFARIREARPEACLRLPNGEEWPGERVLDQLAVESDSQFMFPNLVIGFIDTPFFSPHEQLRILLEAPPPRAFSALDTLYHKILSRRPPVELLQGEDGLQDYQQLVMDVLRVVIAWPGDPLSAAKIAAALEKPVDVVQNAVRGPMRSLFQFHTPDPDSPITLCHKSLRDYLLNRNRSGQFFIAYAEADDLFATILPRQPSYCSHAFSPSTLMDVLAAVVVGTFGYQEKWSVPQISALLDVDPFVVEQVVNSGPTNLLFKVHRDGVTLSSDTLRGFLGDADRSSVLSVSDRTLDALFIRILSRQVPSGASNSYSPRETLLDILAVTAPLYHLQKTVTICRIAALLRVDPRLVERVVKSGTTKWLFRVDEHDQVEVSTQWLKQFLEHADRAGEFFISDRRMDSVFIRILSMDTSSRTSHSSSYSCTILLSVLAAIVAFDGTLTVHEIASALNIDHNLIEGIVKSRPTMPLFDVGNSGVSFLTPLLKDFLLDPDRSGEFFVSDRRMDPFFMRTLRHLPPSNPSSSCSMDVLLGILATLVPFDPWMGQITASIHQVAAWLAVDSRVVEHVVKSGATKWLFQMAGDDKFMFSTRWLETFLQDTERCGEFLVSESRVLDPVFTQVLSHQAVSGPSHSHNVLAGVLALIMAFEEKLMSVHDIASALDVDPISVESVVKFGATRILFDLQSDSNEAAPCICVKFSSALIERFLRDPSRSGKFFLSQSNIDARFMRVLTHAMAPHSSNLRPRDLLMDVLAVVCMMQRQSTKFTLSQIASFLGIDRSLVEGVILGPTKDLFMASHDYVWFSSSSLQPFLEDINRSGEFCITERRMDTLFINIFSREPPLNPSLSYSKTLLMDILTVMVTLPEGPLTLSRLAAALGIDSKVIKTVLLGPAKPLFNVDGKYVMFTVESLKPFLFNADRSGVFFVSYGRIDTLLIRILSSKPPSHPLFSYSRGVLMGVLTALTSLKPLTCWNVPRLAAFLDVDPALIEGVVNIGPSRLLFNGNYTYVGISGPFLEPFLKDFSRSGVFFISERSIDPFFARILSSPPHPTSQAQSCKVLSDAVTISLMSSSRLTAPTIASALDVNPCMVRDVVELGATRLLFNSISSLGSFLRDVERSGKLHINDTMIDSLLLRVLSLPPSSHLSHPHSKSILIGVMAAVLATPEPLTVAKIAALLDIDRSLVESIVHLGRAKVFFSVTRDAQKVTIPSSLLKDFLQDASRSREFFIPATTLLDAIQKPWSQLPEASVGDKIGEEVYAGDGEGSETLVKVSPLTRQGHAGIETVGPTDTALKVSSQPFESLDSDSERDILTDDQEEYWSADDDGGHDSDHGGPKIVSSG